MLGRISVPRAVAAVLLAAVVVTGPAARAGDSSRTGTSQGSVPITFLSGTTIDGRGGSTVDLNDDIGFGIAGGYNLNEHLYLGGELTWIYVNYDATVRSGDTPPGADFLIGGELDAATLHFKAQYNILAKTVTPFIGASAGGTYIDSNIASGPSQGVCWWDPWWGYICDSWRPTFDDTVFSYGANVGIRAELTESFFLEGRYSILWLDTDADTADLDGFRLEVGWRF